nr:hypothetical protein [uncultured bacterium]
MREKMRKAFGVVVVGLGGALAVACSSTPADKYPSPDAFCSAKAVEECQIAGACAVPVEQCKSARHAICMTQATTAQNEGRTYSSGNVQACIDKEHALYLKTPITPKDQADADDTCERVFQGSVAAGGPCANDRQCAGTAICTKGACGNKVSKNPGDFCGNPGEVCTNDSYCSVTVPAKCVPNATQGQTCNTDVLCSANATPSLRCVVGVCQPVQPAGGKCFVNSDCDPKAAPYCDVDNGNVCDDGIRFAISNKGLCSHYGGSL